MGRGADGQANVQTGVTASTESTFLVSTYTDKSLLAHTPKGEHGHGVYTLRLDGDTGKITPLNTTQLGPNVAFILKHPTLNKLYASTECINDDGEVLTLDLDNTTNQLNVLGRQSAAGKSTCYLNLQISPDHMVAVNYWDAKLSVLPVDKNSGDVGSVSDVLMQPKASYVAENKPTRDEHWQFRQRWPHSHCCVTGPNSQYAFVTDLGQDKVFAYTLNREEGRLVQKAEISLYAGRGPRHLIFHNTLPCGFIVNELESSVSVFNYNEKDLSGSEYITDDAATEASILSHTQTISTLPPEMEGQGFITPDGAWKAHSHCSEIRLHPNGQFLFVGNRGHDSIAIFSVDYAANGKLTLVDIHPSGGKCPRNFNFDCSGRYLVVGNQDSNNLTVFNIDLDTGKLDQRDVVDLPSPNYVYAVPQ